MEPAGCLDMATKAIRRKALKDSLQSCSDGLKKQVRKRKLLKKKFALGNLDLRRLAKAAGLGCSDVDAVAVAVAAELAV
jgi:ubiquinone biosynthesis protein Coq4